MALTSSIANLFSFFAPSISTPPPKSLPSQLPLSAATGANTHRWAPLISSNETQPSHSPSCSSSSETMSVVCPSLAYANTMFCESVYNVEIVVEDEDEPEESLVNRFRREVMRAGIIQEFKRRRYYENKQEEKKRRRRDAAKRNRRRRTPFVPLQKSEPEASNKKDDDDDEDNWDLPEEDLLPK